MHTTVNYNGQLTSQKGIHGFWESRLPEIFADDYDYLVCSASNHYSVLDAACNAVEGRFNAVDSVLDFDKQLSEQHEQDKQYSYEKRGQKTLKQKSAEFSEAYYKMLNGMVERRLRLSITTVGDLWLFACVDVG